MATKSDNWNFRIAASDDALVRAASECADLSLSAFVRSAAVAEANRVLADRQRFELRREDWERFQQLLERPAEAPAGLRELFAKPDVFE